MSTLSKDSKQSVLGERTTRAQVNLLPPEIGDVRQFQRVTRYLVYVLIGFVALIGIIFAMALGTVGAAEDRLTDAQDEDVRLRQERTKYAEVLAVEAHLNTARSAESQAMLYEVDWRAYLDGIGAVTPASVTYTELVYSGASAINDLLEPGNQLFGERIGALAIKGITADTAEYGNWIRAIDALPGLEGTWVLESEANQTEDGEIFWEFTGEILIGEEALTNRLVDIPSDESAESPDAEETETEEEEG